MYNKVHDSSVFTWVNSNVLHEWFIYTRKKRVLAFAVAIIVSISIYLCPSIFYNHLNVIYMDESRTDFISEPTTGYGVSLVQMFPNISVASMNR